MARSSLMAGSRNRGEFITGRDAIRTFLTSKWERELDYRLVKAPRASTDNRITVTNKAMQSRANCGRETWL